MSNFEIITKRMIDHLEVVDMIIGSVERAKGRDNLTLTKEDLTFVLTDLNHLRRTLYTTEGLIQGLRPVIKTNPQGGKDAGGLFAKQASSD